MDPITLHLAKKHADKHASRKDNPHGVNKQQIGLGNVENKSSATIRSELTAQNVTNALGYEPESLARRGQADGYASLDANAKIPLNQLPDVSKQQTYVVSDSNERNALTGLIEGDRAYETSTGDSYIWDGSQWLLLAAAEWENVNLDWNNIINAPSSPTANIDDAVNKRHTHSNKEVLDSITQSKVNNWDAHLVNQDNPHNVTKAQVGLGNVDNVKQATKTEFDAHVYSKNNPHDVTKSQVGLGNVQNYGVATEAEAKAGTATNKYMTPQRTKQAIDEHATRTDNPHEVTKEQVGLSNVQNYGVATQSEAEAGTSNSKYMTPLRTKQAVDIHATRTDNPHGVTKAQVGLGNVDNVKQASKSEFDSHVADENNPHGVTKSQVGLGNVDNVKQASKTEFDAHVADTSNPHGVTKSQVGLGSVANYSVASQAEAEAGTASNRYMTPQRTKQAIDKFAAPINHLHDDVYVRRMEGAARIWVQETEPTGASVGDIWIKPGD